MFYYGHRIKRGTSEFARPFFILTYPQFIREAITAYLFKDGFTNGVSCELTFAVTTSVTAVIVGRFSSFAGSKVAPGPINGPSTPRSCS